MPAISVLFRLTNLLAAAVVALLLAAPALARQSPQFRGNAAHTGAGETKAVRSVDGMRFRVQTDGPVRGMAAVDRDLVVFGSGDGTVRAVDRATGAEKWRVQTGGPVNSTPAVANGRVFFTSRDRGLYAVGRGDGSLLWRFEMGPDLPYEWVFDTYLSSPAVDGDRVYIGSGDGHVYAVDAASGRRLWAFDTGARVRSSPAVADGVVYAGAVDGLIRALDAAGGTLIRVFETEGALIDPADYGYDRKAVISSPVVSEGTMFVGGRDGFLYAFDVATGAVTWKYDHEISWVISTPAIDRESVYVGSSDGHFVQSVDRETGAQRWRLDLPCLVWSSVDVVDGVAYVGCGDYNLYALDAATGKELWRYATEDLINSSPVVADGLVYVGSDDGALYAIEGSAASTDVKRAVFWAEEEQPHWFRAGMDRVLRDYFAAQGYEILDASGVAGFMSARRADRAPSLVVFASDFVPTGLIDADTTAASLLRRYLDVGRVVWTGFTPLAWAHDAEGNLSGIDFSIPERVLGIRYGGPDTRGVGGYYRSETTPEGAKWGLSGWFVASNAVTPDQVTTVLARNEYGNASAWYRRFGGPPGTGLVQLQVRRDRAEKLGSIRNAAEAFLR